VSSWNVILLDAINTKFSSQAYAQQMLMKYLDTGPSVQPTAVFGLEGKFVLLHEFTTDTKALREAIAHYNPGGPQHLPTTNAMASPFGRRGSFKAGPRAREVTLNEMLFLADALAGYPGRKNLIWLSEGFPINLFPDALTGGGGISGDYSGMVERIADAMMRGQVAVYPIDAAGVTVNDRFPALSTMQSISERAGGKTFYNRNDLEVGVRTSINDGSTYYTMEYYPSNRNWNGKFRKIEVKVNRPGVQLQYRRGYYALGPNSPGRETESNPGFRFSEALNSNAPSSSGVIFQAIVVPLSEKLQRRYVVKIHIDPRTLSFGLNAEGLQHAAVTCGVWAFPPKGDPIRSEGGILNADLNPEVYQQVMKSYLPCERPIDLPRGQYTLRLGVLDRSTNLIGTASMKLTAP
jgi:VWFA-related protein